MYGAILRPHTELTESGEAHMGVLFLTNEGYSTMCGHATLALGRLLVDCSGTSQQGMGTLDDVRKIDFDQDKKEAEVRLHAPCGLVKVTVPILQSQGRWMTDVNRPISYLSVPSYATAISLPFKYGDNTVNVDIAYGGAFYIIISATSLGFKSLQLTDLRALSDAAENLKAAFNSSASQDIRKKYLKHPEHRDLEFLYGVIVTEPDSETSNSENAICFFADGQVDRSPTGSGVQARVALACAKKQRKLNEPSTYHSPVSKAVGGGQFIGEAVEEVSIGDGFDAVVVKVSGFAKYTGCCSFVIEENDEIGKGFWFDEVMNSKQA